MNIGPLQTKINLNYVQIFSPYRAVNTIHLGYKNQPVSFYFLVKGPAADATDAPQP
jgi:hypothetical protein